MFNDWLAALEAESLPLRPSPVEELAAASRVTARHARDKDDLTELLSCLGAPTDEDTLTGLLPHLPDTVMTGDNVTTQAPSAYTTVAASMLNNGDDPQHVRTTLGLSEEELTDALQHVDTTDTDTEADLDTDTSQAADPEPSRTTDGGAAHPAAGPGIEALLTWGEQHDTKSVQALAARARTALAELAQRRDTERAVADAEAQVGKLENQLARAREQLRQAKNTKHTAPAPAVQAPAAKRRTKDELAAIRTWARSNGHQVADRGLPAQTVLDAYDAAHPNTPAKAS